MNKQIIVHLLLVHAYKRAPENEPFTLASGLKSVHYVDVRALALRSDGAEALGLALTSIIGRMEQKGHPLKVDGVAGVVLGGCPLATATSLVALRHHARILPAVFVRKDAKVHGTGRLLELPSLAPSERLHHVVLLEDVVTTGESSIAAAENLEQAGMKVEAILAVVDRRPAAATTLGRWPFASLVTLSDLIEEAR